MRHSSRSRGYDEYEDLRDDAVGGGTRYIQGSAVLGRHIQKTGQLLPYIQETGMAVAAYYDAGRPQSTELTEEQRLAKAAMAGSFGALCGSLPDLIEPAVHPNHRQFFHSIAFALMLAHGLRQLYRWDPHEP